MNRRKLLSSIPGVFAGGALAGSAAAETREIVRFTFDPEPAARKPVPRAGGLALPAWADEFRDSDARWKVITGMGRRGIEWTITRLLLDKADDRPLRIMFLSPEPDLPEFVCRTSFPHAAVDDNVIRFVNGSCVFLKRGYQELNVWPDPEGKYAERTPLTWTDIDLTFVCGPIIWSESDWERLTACVLRKPSAEIWVSRARCDDLPEAVRAGREDALIRHVWARASHLPPGLL